MVVEANGPGNLGGTTDMTIATATKATPTKRTAPARQPRVPSTESLIKSGAQLITELSTVETHRTQLYKRLAVVVTSLRGKFSTVAGTPDWSGRTQPYRDAVGRMYAEAGIPEDSASNIQTALRYHIGNQLRERLTPDELTAAGLSTTSPRNAAATRQNNSAAGPGGANALTPAQRKDWTISEYLAQAFEFVTLAGEAPPPLDLEPVFEIIADLRTIITQIEDQLSTLDLTTQSHGPPTPQRRSTDAPARARV